MPIFSQLPRDRERNRVRHMRIHANRLDEKEGDMNTDTTAVRLAGEQGISLVETMIATLITIVGLSSVLGLFAVGMLHSQTQGDVASRVTTSCQAKIEELSALAFNDATTDTTVWPPAATGTGTGLCGNLAANSNRGSVDPAAPLAGYVDYLDFQGTRVAADAVDANGQLRQSFMRQWRIETGATINLKTIIVRTTATRTLSRAIAPFTVLSTQKSR